MRMVMRAILCADLITSFNDCTHISKHSEHIVDVAAFLVRLGFPVLPAVDSGTGALPRVALHMMYYGSVWPKCCTLLWSVLLGMQEKGS